MLTVDDYLPGDELFFFWINCDGTKRAYTVKELRELELIAVDREHYKLAAKYRDRIKFITSCLQKNR